MDAQLTQDIFIFVGQHHSRMSFAAFEVAQLLHSMCGILIFHGCDRQSHQDFIGVESRIAAALMIDFQSLDWLDILRLNQLGLFGNVG